MHNRLIGPTGAATARPSTSPRTKGPNRRVSTLPSSPLGARTTTKKHPQVSGGVSVSRVELPTPSLPAPGAGLLHAGAGTDRADERGSHGASIHHGAVSPKELR